MDRGYIDKAQFQEINSKAEETGKLTGGLMGYLQKSEIRGNKFK